MVEEVLIFALIFGTIFGVFYLYFSTRNKERLALIEKGADANIFVQKSSSDRAPFWRIFTLNLSLLSIGIGIGIFIAAFLTSFFGLDNSVAFPGSIFLMAGIGLFAAFTLTKNMDKAD